MKVRLPVAVAILFLAGCSGIHLVSDYDEVIDKGVMDFAEQLDAHVKNMADLAGTADGAYEPNIKTYNALDAKLDVLIARASASSGGVTCKLEQKVFDRLKSMMQGNLPATLQQGGAGSATASAGEACNALLLVLVKNQLALIRTIHRDTDKCAVKGAAKNASKMISCIRPATSSTALSIANQSINAVAVVENAKK